jgi:hypothetical protein
MTHFCASLVDLFMNELNRTLATQLVTHTIVAQQSVERVDLVNNSLRCVYLFGDFVNDMMNSLDLQEVLMDHKYDRQCTYNVSLRRVREQLLP